MWAIPEQLQSEIVRVLGFPDVLGSASIQSGYPGYASELSMFQPYAMLMQKLQYLATATSSAVRIFGAEHPAFASYYASASFSLAVTTPSTIANGATINLVINGAPTSVTAGVSETVTTLAVKIVTALNAAGGIYATNTAGLVTAYAQTPGKAGNGITVLAVSSDPSALINGAQAYSGATYGGSDPPGPYLSDPNLGSTIWGYLPVIRVLENDIAVSRSSLKFSTADVVTYRPSELSERNALLHRYRRELADRLGVPLDPDIVGNRRKGRSRVI